MNSGILIRAEALMPYLPLQWREGYEALVCDEKADDAWWLLREHWPDKYPRVLDLIQFQELDTLPAEADVGELWCVMEQREDVFRLLADAEPIEAEWELRDE